MTSLSARRPLVAFLLGLLAVGAGCIPALQNRVAANAIPRPRLAATPPQIIVYTLDASDHRSFEEQPSSSVADEAEGALREILDPNGVRFAGRDALVACGVPCLRLVRWGTLATLEIGLQREQIRNYGFHSVADWGFRADLSAVRESLDADFALFVTLKQTRQTTGRKVLMALGGGYTIGKQIDAACVADLHDGRMVWCTSLKDDSGDIQAPGRVPQVLRTLLHDLSPAVLNDRVAARANARFPDPAARRSACGTRTLSTGLAQGLRPWLPPRRLLDRRSEWSRSGGCGPDRGREPNAAAPARERSRPPASRGRRARGRPRRECERPAELS
ncbi:MAG TPA: hypothetical protein VH853_25570 [Polyangia bacterium]|jgi:hypothetical protein|nr:hypothetical protein [Polyangia bacterium]